MIIYFIPYIIMLIRDAIDGFFAIIGQPWATHSIWQKYILTIAQMALVHIWNYKWYNWTWQYWKDSFLMTQGETIKLVTTHPIKRVHKFYEWQMKPRDWVLLNPQSFCDECPNEWPVCVPCACECNPCKDLEYIYANPQDKLCPWYYQVSGSEYQWMWWFWGSIIRVMPRRQLDWLWVTYFRDVPRLKSFDEKFPLPMAFMTPFCYYMAFIAMGRYWQFRSWEDVNFLQVANMLMEDLKESDAPNHLDMTFSNTTQKNIVQFLN